jgi:predicted Fe-Mo cluster-binding NifX family protein
MKPFLFFLMVGPLEEQGGKNSRMSEHFGSAPYYAVADTGAGSFEIITNTSMHHDHGQCTPADFFAELGVSALICIGIGAGAIAKLRMLGIDVFMVHSAHKASKKMAVYSAIFFDMDNSDHHILYSILKSTSPKEIEFMILYLKDHS